MKTNNHCELLSAAEKAWAVFQDLGRNNPGFLGKLVLQDYAQYNETMIELPRAIARTKLNMKAKAP